mgnify:FL=1
MKRQGKIVMDKKISEYEIANCINVLGNFCGKRDIDELTAFELMKKYGVEKADVMVLFGGSILAGGDILGNAMKNDVAKKYVIVGGRGHTTASLEEQFYKLYPDSDKNSILSEISEAFRNYLKHKYNLQPDFLEIHSTNCGNNITNLLKLLKEKNITFKNTIISQDATMQLRMEAILKKYLSENIKIINFATYSAKVCVKDEKLCFENYIFGMRDIDRYITLLMGEIARLTDDENGYGPKGAGYTAHIDIPEDVKNAFFVLKQIYGDKVRKANPLYASK